MITNLEPSADEEQGRARKVKRSGPRGPGGSSRQIPGVGAPGKAAIRRDELQIRRKADAILDNGAVWLQSPNLQYGGRKPIDLVRSGLKKRVSDTLDAIKFGMFS